jgi:hypothetical protein
MRLSGKVHTDLIKIQAEFGARHTYRKAATDIRSLTGNDRSIINRSRIQRTTKRVGKILEDNDNEERDKDKAQPLVIEPAKKLCVAVDGGHVHDANNKGHNFEAMLAKVYRPENVKRVDKHHTEIIQKHCAGSAKYDKQKTMKSNVIEAAKKEGLDKNVTEVTVLADGAKNCWNIAEALKSLCCVFICILDWFHIGKYVQNLKAQLPTEYKYILDAAKAELWLGKADSALDILSKLQSDLKSEEPIKKANNFVEYIKENREHIINYDERKKSGLIYTSHVAESTVEHLLNERGKKHQKMQWSRDGLHAVLQIRASQASNEWETDWKNNIFPRLQSTAA